MKSHDLLPLAAAGILLAGCSRPKLEASLDARPGPARIDLPYQLPGCRSSLFHYRQVKNLCLP